VRVGEREKTMEVLRGYYKRVMFYSKPSGRPFWSFRGVLLISLIS
jgi:hypothetical protein